MFINVQQGHQHWKPFLLAVGLVACWDAFAAPAAVRSSPGTEKLTFANPLDLEYRMRPEADKNFREGADPDVVMWKGRYWLFASKCGGYFVSDDLAKWTLVRTDDLPLEEYAPSAWVMDGNLYFSSRGGSVHRAVDAAAGKWERVKGKVRNTVDSKLFDEGGRLYDYYGGAPTNVPLWVQELDPRTFDDIGEKVPITEMDDSRFGWDISGDSNEMIDGKPGWKEGAHMIKRGGTYYFQYATPGTQYATYCDVALVGSSPTGPFTRQRVNPFSFKPTGYAKGAGHGCTICDRHGNYWHITTCVVSGVNRRIVMLPVFFDPDGEMWCDTAFADWPMAIPDHRTASPQDYHTGWMPLTYGKSVSVSSCAKGTRKEALVDENMRSIWSAATGNAGEWAEVDLGGVAEVRAVQIGFAETGECAPWRAKDAARRWRLEVSEDGKAWKCAVDESGAMDAADHPYRVLKAPARAAKIRVVCVGVPDGTTFALREIRAFGRMDVPLPQTPESLAAVRDCRDRRRARVSWKAAKGTEGYVVRYGPAPDKLHLSLIVRDACETEVRALDTEQDYWWTVEAFNAAGFSAATAAVGQAARGRGRRLAARQDQSEAGENARGARSDALGGRSTAAEARKTEKTAKIAPLPPAFYNFVRLSPCASQGDMVSLLRFHGGMASAGWSARKSRQGRAVRVRECIVPLNWENCIQLWNLG